MISANLNLKSQPAILKAALLASAFRKIDTTNYGTVEGDAPYLSDKEGAGKLDSKNAIYVIASNNYTYEYFWSTTNEYTFTLHASSAETQMRVALTWLKQCVFNASDLESASIGHGDWASVNVLENRPMSDWDLEIYDPNGELISYSRARNGNVEIAEFDPNLTGNYTVKIIKVGGTAPKEFVYLAWW